MQYVQAGQAVNQGGQQVIMTQAPIQTQHVVAAPGQVLVAAGPGQMMTTVNGQQLYAVQTSPANVTSQTHLSPVQLQPQAVQAAQPVQPALTAVPAAVPVSVSTPHRPEL